MWLSSFSSALENDMFFIIDDSDADLATFVLHENVTICKWNKWNEVFKSFLFPSLWRLTPRPHYQAVASLSVCGSGRSFLSH